MITKIAIENFKGIGGRVELKCEAFHPDSEDYFSGPEPDEPEWQSDRFPGIPTKPLTLLFGPNSGGKSTILHALHYAREIFERLDSNANRTISGGDFVDLGGFANLVHDHDLEKTVWLLLDWVETNYGQYDDLREDDFDLHETSLEIGIRWDSARNQPHISTYRLASGGKLMAEVKSEPSLKRVYLSRLELDHPSFIGDLSEPYTLAFGKRYGDREETCLSRCWEDASKWFQRVEGSTPASAENKFVPVLLEGQSCALPLPGEKIKIAFPRDKYNRPKYDSLARAVANELSRLLTDPIDWVCHDLKQFRYLGPLRETPSRHHAAPRLPDASRWSSGLGAWDELQTGDAELVREVSSWLGDKDRLDAGYTIQRKEFKAVDPNDPTVSNFLAGEATAEACEQARLRLNQLPTQTRLVIRPNQRKVELDPHDVGVGISQVVPVVVTALAGQNRLVAIEQPELHLHPKLEANLADLFIESALGHRSHTVILETHSEHLILRLLRRIRETSAGKPHRDLPVTPNDVAVYYISQQDGETKLTRIDIDMHGEFVQPWPDDFFELDFYERFGDAR